MPTLTGAPFTLAFDTLVKVRISAINNFGTGLTSTVNTSGARIRSVPNSPTIVRGASTTTT